jgi:hypothetical protein
MEKKEGRTDEKKLVNLRLGSSFSLIVIDLSKGEEIKSINPSCFCTYGALTSSTVYWESAGASCIVYSQVAI